MILRASIELLRVVILFSKTCLRDNCRFWHWKTSKNQECIHSKWPLISTSRKPFYLWHFLIKKPNHASAAPNWNWAAHDYWHLPLGRNKLRTPLKTMMIAPACPSVFSKRTLDRILCHHFIIFMLHYFRF